MSKKLMSWCALFLGAALIAACGPEDGTALGEFELTTDDAFVEMMRSVDGDTCSETLEPETSDDAAAEGDAEAGPQVDVWVCIGGVCGWTKGTLEKDGSITVNLPNDPALIGLEVTGFCWQTGKWYRGTYGAGTCAGETATTIE